MKYTFYIWVFLGVFGANSAHATTYEEEMIALVESLQARIEKLESRVFELERKDASDAKEQRMTQEEWEAKLGAELKKVIRKTEGECLKVSDWEQVEKSKKADHNLELLSKPRALFVRSDV